MKEQESNEEFKKFQGGEINPFRVPDNYFEELPSRINDRITSVPNLEHTPASNPFEVPSGYFETLPGSISDKIAGRKHRLGWLSKVQRPRVALPIAFATIILLAGLYFMKMKHDDNPVREEFSLNDLRNSEYLQEIDESLIVEFLSEETEDTTIENYEQYLLDNNIELSQIENAL